MVLVKNHNETIVRHAYIKAGCSYKFEVANGSYECYFYYGQDWNPNKEMSDGILGGFVENENFNNSGFKNLSNDEITYTLQLILNENFSPENSNQEEMFQ